MKLVLFSMLMLLAGCSERDSTATPIPPASFVSLPEEIKVAVRQSKKLVLFCLTPWHGTFHEHRIFSTKEVLDEDDITKLVYIARAG